MNTQSRFFGLLAFALLAVVVVGPSRAQLYELHGKKQGVVSAPTIVVTPDAIADSMLINEVKTRTLKIRNTGDGDLSWQIDIARSFNGRLDGIHIVWDRAHGQPPASTYSVMMSELAARGATVSENFDEISPQVLDEVDVLWAVDFTSAWSTPEMEAVRNWVWSGGGLLLEVDSSVSVPTVNTLLNVVKAGLHYGTWTVGTGYATNIVSHPATAGVDTVYVIGADAYISLMSFPSGPLVWFGGVAVAAQGTFGTRMGAVVALSDEMFYNPGPGGPSADNIAFGHGAVDWLVNVIRWATAEPVSGVLVPGDSAEVLVTLDPRMLYQGVFHAEARVRSDDPVYPEVIVPIRLAVKGIPRMRLSTLNLAYGIRRPGESATNSFQVANDGSGELVVGSITSSEPHYTPSPASFVLLPEESLLVDVTFMSTSEGTFNGTLTIPNNDPNTGPAYIQLSAVVADSAHIVLSADSIVDSLWAGEIARRDLTIENRGGRALTWQIGVWSLSGVKILYDRSKGQGAPTPYGLLLSDLAAVGAAITENSGYISPELLASVDIYWTTEMQRSWSGSEVNNLKVWTSAGGKLLLEGDEDVSVSNFNSLLPKFNSGIVYSGVDGTAGVTTNVFAHEITRGVDHVLAGGPRANLSLVSAPAAPLLADVAGAKIAAASTPGSGRVVGLADEILADPFYFEEDNRILGNGIFAWLGEATPWLSVSADTGSVVPHSAVQVEVTLDARSLSGGVYRGALRIVSNDPQDPQILLPVRLHVFDVSIIDVSPDTLDFNVVLIDSTAERTLVVRNKGLASLSITNISSDVLEFSPDRVSFDVAPGDSEEVSISFAPSAVGPVSGTLSITSSDRYHGVVTVALEGEGFEVQDVAISPGALADTLFSGATSDKILTIRNAGPGPFEWSVSFIRRATSAAAEVNARHDADPALAGSSGWGPRLGSGDLVPGVSGLAAGANRAGSAGSDLTGVRILFDRSRGQETSVNWSVLVSDLVARGAEVVENTTPITTSLLDGYDIYWGIDMTSAWSSAERTALVGWVQNGGGLLLMGDQDPALGAFNSLLTALGAGISFLDGGSAAGVTTRIDPHETTFGVDSLTMSAPHARLYSLATPAVRLFSASNLAAMGAAAIRGNGKVVAIAEEVFGNDVILSTDNRQFGNQVMNWLAPVVGWLSASPSAGTVAEGDSAHVVVRFDAAGRCAGDYQATILMVCGPVDVVVAEIPARLHTIAAPHLAVSSPAVVFDGVFVGNSTREILTIRNDGCAALTVSDLAVDSPSFSVDTTTFDLAAGESRQVELTFQPIVAGLNQGLLAIQSSDPVQSAVSVSLSGEGIAPPGIAVSPDSLAERLLPGAASFRTLSITNPGSAPLEYVIDCIGRPNPASKVTGCVSPSSAGRVAPGVAERVLEPYETAGPPLSVSPDPKLSQDETADLPFDGSPVFTEDFEDGDYDGWVKAAGAGVREVTDQTAANGTTYSYHDVAADYGHFTGIHRDLGSAQIRTVRFWVRAGSKTTNSTYFVLRDSAGLEAIFFFATQLGTFYVNANVGGNQSCPYEPGTWYPVEFTNIDWEAKTFDYSVGGALVQTGIPFRNAGQVEDFSRVDFYNYTKGAQAWWDEIWISTGHTIDWVRAPVREGVITSDSTGAVGLVFDANGLAPGAHEALVIVRTNVPSQPVVTVPAKLDVDSAFARVLLTPLETGWNAVSWNVDTSNDSVSVLLAGVTDHLAVAHGFDGGGLTYDPNVPPEFNTLATVDHRHGCRLKMTAPDTLTVTGWALDAQTPAIVEPGYNLIGYVPNQMDSIAHALASVLEHTTLVVGYEGTTLVFDPQGDPSGNTLHVLEPGAGYWLKVSDKDTLIYPRLPVIPLVPVFGSSPGDAPSLSSLVTPTPEWISVWGDGIVFGGPPLPTGATVRAVDPGGVVCGEWLVTSPGRVGLMPVYGDDVFTPEDEGAEPGDTIRVYVDDTLLTDDIIWETNGAVVNLNEIFTGLPTVSLENRLFQNHPNPFNPTTTIKYSIVSAGHVSLKIYNATGQLVRTLVDEEQAPRQGGFSLVWNGLNDRGEPVASGVYFYRLTAKNFEQTKKLVVLK